MQLIMKIEIPKGTEIMEGDNKYGIIVRISGDEVVVLEIPQQDLELMKANKIVR